MPVAAAPADLSRARPVDVTIGFVPAGDGARPETAG
jgi:hypothetical protein